MEKRAKYGEERQLIIYDCEIVKVIPPSANSKRLEGVEYCGGWRDFENMGISVICAYEYEGDRYRVFCKDNFNGFQELIESSKLIVSFNGLEFDNKLCRVNGIDVPNERSYDLLREIWNAAGLGPDYEYHTHAGFGLDDCIKANFGEGKSGHGALTPVQWQRGEIGSVIDYCLQDVRLTKKLIDKILECGELNSPKGGILRVRKPI